jgi:peptidoglycan/LPS O-acetylase OafA/YrhL
MRENPLTRVAQGIARYSYGIYLLHYMAIWIGFVVCRSLNVGVQIAIFAAVLVSLSVLLYHTVEAPLIAAGINVSKKLMHRSCALGVKSHSPGHVSQICSE